MASLSDLEKNLLGNLLDALDRLYDGKTRVIDVHAILMATSQALSHTGFAADLERPLGALKAVIRASVSEDLAQEAALGATDALRRRIAGKL